MISLGSGMSELLDAKLLPISTGLTIILANTSESSFVSEGRVGDNLSLLSGIGWVKGIDSATLLHCSMWGRDSTHWGWVILHNSTLSGWVRLVSQSSLVMLSCCHMLGERDSTCCGQVIWYDSTFWGWVRSNMQCSTSSTLLSHMIENLIRSSHQVGQVCQLSNISALHCVE